MADLMLQASDDHVARIAHEGDPVRAVVELIWNAIDAEASTVDVILKRSDMDAIEQVCVTDDGHGIASTEVESTFGRIGGSWKQRAKKSKNDKRTLHGKLGEGRLRALALGSSVTWSSRSRSVTAEPEVVTISGTAASETASRGSTAPRQAMNSPAAPPLPHTTRSSDRSALWTRRTSWQHCARTSHRYS